MAGLAFLFPGQGSQQVGMGKALAQSSPRAAEVFAEADATLGFALSKLCFEGPEDELTLTRNTQPAVLATSIAALRLVEERGLKPEIVAGHSLGEYTALVAAGALGLTDALRLVASRGRFMQEAVPVGEGAMAAVIGLDAATVEKLCREAAQGQTLAAANYNAPDQIVIAGHRSAVERGIELARAAGAKRALLLPVSAPFHSPLMAPARVQLEPLLEKTPFRDLELPLVNNVDAALVLSGAAARRGLARQVDAPVRWVASVERLLAEGVRRFVEVGPGRVLSGLVRRIDRSAVILNVEDPESLELSVAELGGDA